MTDFKTIKKELYPLLQKAEKIRKVYRFFKKANSLFLQFILIIGITFPLFIFLLHSKFTEWFGELQKTVLWSYSTQLSMLLFWALFFLSTILAGRHKVKYDGIEKQILKTFIGKIAPTFKYYGHRQIKPLDLANSELFSTNLLSIEANKAKKSIYNLNQGVLSGKVGSTSIRMGNVKLLSQKPSSFLAYIPFFNYLYMMYDHGRPWFSKKRSIDQIGSSFNGMFAMIDFNKKFNGTTVVLPDYFEKRIGYLAKTIQSLNRSGLQLVNLEDSEFEKGFVVYGTDQVQARYILSLSLIQRITALREKVRKPVMLSFKNNKVYIAIEHPHGFLSLKQDENLLHSNAFELIYGDITTAIGIVEDLNLNTRIWKK